MQLKPEHIQQALQHARDVAEHYKSVALAPDAPDRSVDWLRMVCEQYLHKKIIWMQLEDVTAETSAVLAACMMLPGDTYHIPYVSGLDPNMRRFVLCKEIFHAILDALEYHNMEVVEHVSELTTRFVSNDTSASVWCEYLAELAAVEFLFPYSERVKELEGPFCNNFTEIAGKYRLPQQLVERYLAPSFMEALKHFA